MSCNIKNLNVAPFVPCHHIEADLINQLVGHSHKERMKYLLPLLTGSFMLTRYLWLNTQCKWWQMGMCEFGVYSATVWSKRSPETSALLSHEVKSTSPPISCHYNSTWTQRAPKLSKFDSLLQIACKGLGINPCIDPKGFKVNQEFLTAPGGGRIQCSYGRSVLQAVFLVLSSKPGRLSAAELFFFFPCHLVQVKVSSKDLSADWFWHQSPKKFSLKLNILNFCKWCR